MSSRWLPRLRVWWRKRRDLRAQVRSLKGSLARALDVAETLAADNQRLRRENRELRDVRSILGDPS